MSGISGHETPIEGATNDWLTPPWLIEALGPFDLDPCANVNQPWPTASQQITESEDGLAQKWKGFVWCNPPYGAKGWPFLERMAEHQNGIALVFARTETKGFFEHVWYEADSLLFFKGRLAFHESLTGERAKGNAGAPSVLVAYGNKAKARIARARASGVLIGSLVYEWI